MEGGRDQQRVQHVFMKIRAARHPLRERGKRGVGRWCGGVIGGVAGLLQRLLPRKALGIAQPQRLPRAARDAPVAVEQRLRLRRQRALGGKAQVEPGRLTDAADEVFIGQVAPARPHHLTIGDQQLAVVAQVDAPAPRPPQRRHEQARAHARVLQHGVVAVRAFQAADAVDQQAHPHAGARAVGQGGGHGGAHFVIAQHVGAKVQRVARRADHALQLRQRRLAIRFKPHHRLRPRAGHAQRRQQPRGPQRRQRGPRPGRRRLARCGRAHHLARAEDQKQRQPQVREGRNPHHPGQRRVRVPPLAPHARDHQVGQQPRGHESHVFQRGEGGQADHAVERFAIGSRAGGAGLASAGGRFVQEEASNHEAPAVCIVSLRWLLTTPRTRMRSSIKRIAARACLTSAGARKTFEFPCAPGTAPIIAPCPPPKSCSAFTPLACA